MNEYKIVKVRGEGQYPFTYRGENEVLLGSFEKIFRFRGNCPPPQVVGIQKGQK